MKMPAASTAKDWSRGCFLIKDQKQLFFPCLPSNDISRINPPGEILWELEAGAGQKLGVWTEQLDIWTGDGRQGVCG